MWIITTSGFVSLVKHQTKPDFVRARARRREHLADTFDLMDGDIIDLGPNCPDYRWHCDVPKTHAAQKLYDAVLDVTYVSHVKENVAKDDSVFYGSMLGCWRELHRLQDPPGQDDWAEVREQQQTTLNDLDDIASQIGDLADRMLSGPDLDDEPRWAHNPPPTHDPLVEYGWTSNDAVIYGSECLMCGSDLNSADPYVIIPEDETFHEPEGPAHVQCAHDEGWDTTA